MSFYRPLDPTKHEIRMLTIVDPPEGDTSGLVHCTLEHVSLGHDALTPEFAQFLSETNQSCNEVGTRSWVEKTGHRDDTHHEPSPPYLKLPVWRWANELDKAPNVLGGDDTIEASGIDYFKSPGSPHEVIAANTVLRFRAASPGSPLEIIDANTPLEFRAASPLMELGFVPRFKWGDFEAVSYCWGSGVREMKVVINQEVLEVPKNLEALLQKIRRLPDAKSGMKFWIDALCINQSDTHEKNHQVKLMQTIYTKAFAVVIWLGEGTEDGAKAIEFVSSHCALEEEEEAWGENEIARLPWFTLIPFFLLAYWRRLWIIQELALNHHMSLFLCGERQLSRRMILRTSEFYQRNSFVIDGFLSNRWNQYLQGSSISVLDSIWPTIYQVHCLITTRGHHIDASHEPHHISAYHRRLHNFPQVKGPSMNVVLDLCRKANVTDPRDKVYGILGLLPPNIAALISPDYELSYQQVFYQFARIMLQDENGLEAILSWCTYNPLSSLSSWIPDWTTHFSRNHIQWLRRRKAAGSAAAQCSISPNDSCADKQYLTCKGFIFDSINSVSASLSENLSYASEAQAAHQPLTSTSFRPYDDERNLKAALWRTLRQDHPYLRDTEKTCLDIRWIDWSALSRDADGPYPNIWDSMPTITQNVFWETFESFRQTNANFSIFGLKFRDMFPEMDPWSKWWVAEDNKDSEHIELLNQMASDMHLVVLALTGRRLITTSTGYLGLAPAEVLEGDVIAVLYGCNFPVVLRPCADKFYVIGECYVDGVMDGELMDAKERGEYRERDIILC